MSTVQTFEYRGRDASGKVVKGKVEATSEGAVVSRLGTMGIAPITVAETKPGVGLNRDISLGGLGSGGRVKLKDLAVASRQLATMIGAGLSLIRALNILSEQTESKPLSHSLEQVRNDIERGTGFSESLAKQPLVFPPLMIHMVRSGETGGFLDDALESIAKTFEADVKLRGTIKSALTYPVVVLIMAVLAVIGMLIFIVPVFEKMFKDLGSELPLPTQLLVIVSRNMIWLGPLLLVAAIGFTVWWRANKHKESVRRVVDPVKLKLPVFGKLFTKVAVARFSRNLSTMIGAGVPIMQALGIVGETSGNWVVEDALRKVQDSVRKGNTIAAPLAMAPVFPSMVTQMISVGEDSGSLEPMLEKVADFYDEEVQSTTEALTALIEPLMIAFIGIVIGGMIVALYLPIFSIMGAVK